MATMAVGWSDLGSWTQLLAAIGATGAGRVVAPNERAAATGDDLVIERVGGTLVVDGGPRDILAQSPVALLSGAAPSREQVEALVGRVVEWEAQRS
jgi:hypothetical protein